MKSLRWIPILFIPLMATDAISTEEDSVKHQNQLLETELKIAQSPHIYFIFDLKDKRVYLKARGLVFRELKIETLRLWGNASAGKAASLLKKSTLFSPKRGMIKPRTNNRDEEFSMETLELKDMPTNYTLILEENLSISVRPKPTHMISSLWSIQYPAKWYLTRPVLTVWYALWRKPFTSIEIVLEKNDARTLYWSFLEGMKGIVFSPGSQC
jgi:hypothetical protein